ncbi:hypothetical protein OH687_30570 [Burkholderia anthina]|nr:hypothetical protein OH687_30570 [Burkholderia anthina]
MEKRVSGDPGRRRFRQGGPADDERVHVYHGAIAERGTPLRYPISAPTGAARWPKP